MQYKDFCKAIGIEKIEAEAENVYINAEENGELCKALPMMSMSTLFPRTAEEVQAAAKVISENDVYLRYMNFLRVCYDKKIDAFIPILTPEKGNTVRNFAPLFAILSFANDAEESMKARGIDAEMRNRVHSVYDRFLIEHKETHGFSAISPTIYFWARHYHTPDIFSIGSLEFEITTLPSGETVFREKTGGKITALRDVEETADAFLGKEICRGGEDGKVRTLPKSEFEQCLVPGDDILSVHIPRGAKVDEKTLAGTYRDAKAFFAMYYPEKRIKAFYCRSWLMDPALSEILSEGSNILSFQRFFGRYPVHSSGKEVFSFVHPTPFERYEDLPETTSLLRSLKKRYIENEPIYVYAGVHMWESGKNQRAETRK